jgi:flagellar biosynthetic protein FliQ
MTENEAIHILGRAILVATELALPILIVALVIGVAISLLQAVTQVQEMTLTFVPKLAGIIAVIVIMGHWMMTVLLDYTTQLFDMIPRLVR